MEDGKIVESNVTEESVNDNADTKGALHDSVTKTGPKCMFCSSVESALPAEVLCEQCGYFYCYECLNSLHPRRGPFTNHRIQKVKSVGEARFAEILCRHHDESLDPRPAQVFCSWCNIFICSECAVTRGRHQMHAQQRPEEHAQSQLGQIQEHVFDLRRLETETQKRLSDVKLEIEQFQFKYKSDTLEIQKLCARLHSRLLEVENEILLLIQEAYVGEANKLEKRKSSDEITLKTVESDLSTCQRVLELPMKDIGPIAMSNAVEEALKSSCHKNESRFSFGCVPKAKTFKNDSTPTGFDFPNMQIFDQMLNSKKPFFTYSIPAGSAILGASSFGQQPKATPPPKTDSTPAGSVILGGSPFGQQPKATPPSKTDSRPTGSALLFDQEAWAMNNIREKLKKELTLAINTIFGPGRQPRP